MIGDKDRIKYDAFVSIAEMAMDADDLPIDVEHFVSTVESGIAADIHWSSTTKGILKAEIARRHLSYKDLAQRLAAIGVTETEANLRNKISRGGFSAVFFVQCLVAIGARTVRLREAD
jgi:hypothetical protein